MVWTLSSIFNSTIKILLPPYFGSFNKTVPSSAERWQNSRFDFSARFFISFLDFAFSGISIVLAVAEGEVFVNDAEIQKSALQVVINCVCAPDKRMSSIGKFIAGTPRRRLPQQTKASESVLTKMWNVVQSNNGIKVELNYTSHWSVFDFLPIGLVQSNCVWSRPSGQNVWGRFVHLAGSC